MSRRRRNKPKLVREIGETWGYDKITHENALSSKTPCTDSVNVVTHPPTSLPEISIEVEPQRC